MLFKTLIPNKETFKWLVWDPLINIFTQEQFFKSNLITSDKTYFMLSSQYNKRTLRYDSAEFVDYLSVILVEQLPALFVKMNVWLDATIAATIADPSQRGNIRKEVLDTTINSVNAPSPFAGTSAPIDDSDFALDKNRMTNRGDNEGYDYNVVSNLKNLFDLQYASEWKHFLVPFNDLFTIYQSYNDELEVDITPSLPIPFNQIYDADKLIIKGAGSVSIAADDTNKTLTISNTQLPSFENGVRFTGAQFIQDIAVGELYYQRVCRVPINATASSGKAYLSFGYHTQAQLSNAVIKTPPDPLDNQYQSTSWDIVCNLQFDFLNPNVADRVRSNTSYFGLGGLNVKTWTGVDMTNPSTWYFEIYTTLSPATTFHYDWFNFYANYGDAGVPITRAMIDIAEAPADNSAPTWTPTKLTTLPAYVSQISQVYNIQDNKKAIDNLINRTDSIGGKNVLVGMPNNYSSLESVDTTTNGLIPQIMIPSLVYDNNKTQLKGSASITITTDDLNNALTFTAVGGTPAPDTELRAKLVDNSTGQTSAILNTEPTISTLRANNVFLGKAEATSTYESITAANSAHALLLPKTDAATTYSTIATNNVQDNRLDNIRSDLDSLINAVSNHTTNFTPVMTLISGTPNTNLNLGTADLARWTTIPWTTIPGLLPTTIASITLKNTTSNRLTIVYATWNSSTPTTNILATDSNVNVLMGPAGIQITNVSAAEQNGWTFENVEFHGLDISAKADKKWTDITSNAATYNFTDTNTKFLNQLRITDPNGAYYLNRSLILGAPTSFAKTESTWDFTTNFIQTTFYWGTDQPTTLHSYTLTWVLANSNPPNATTGNGQFTAAITTPTKIEALELI